jgi:hypothetical protein
MTQYCYKRLAILIVIIGLLPLVSDARYRSNAVYDGAVGFGSQLVHLEDGCLDLDGTITSGTFFDDLKRTEIGNRFEFRKRGRIVTEYPESLTTSIHIAGNRCADTLSNRPSSIFHGDSFTLKFQLEWKDGLQLRPAGGSPLVAQCTGSSSTPIPRQDFTIPLITCKLTVDSKGIPLNNHLIVSVFAEDGTRLTRLSAAP